MNLRMNGFWSAAMWTALVAGLSAQTPAPAGPEQARPTPTFRVQIDAVTMDVITKDSQGRFVADLTKDEFEIFEDGVKQEIASMTMSHGGRVTNALHAPPPVAPEGVILPPRRVATDTSGRIFLFFVDDLHLQFHSTSRVRDLFRRISKQLVHDGDLFGIVSSGTSSIAVDMTYDRKRLDEAIARIAGNGVTPVEIIETSTGARGPSELRHRAQVAFTTMKEALRNLEKVQNRRKALVWVSEGYDFNPFQASRLSLLGEDSPFTQNSSNMPRTSTNDDGSTSYQEDPRTSLQKQNEEFSDADLAYEMGEITRAANRSNTTIYTIDPRGLVAGSDIDQQIDPTEWTAFVRKSQDTLRVLADETGGISIINTNGFDQALKRIDAETSDYYVLGYYSKNPDLSKRRRRIEVRVTRQDVDLWSRTEYVVPLPAAAAPAPGR
jgi:VWFA-related protein